MSKQHIRLNKTDREYLKTLLSKGKLPAKMYKRATALLELDRGKSLQEVAQTVGSAYLTVAAWRDNYKEEGLQCLQDKPRSGRPIEIDGKQRAKITALACSPAPSGRGRWDLRLLADKAVELGYCEKISHTQVAKILKKTCSSRTSREAGA
jgi:putative transposase